jgi:hypothetical protein
MRIRKTGREAMGWSTTRGEVLGTQVLKECASPIGDCYRPEIRYTYTVMGQTYESDTYNIGKQVTASHPDRAAAIAARYPEGTQIDVYYNPDDPASSCLKRKVRSIRSLVIVSIVLFAAALLFFLGIAKV